MKLQAEVGSERHEIEIQSDGSSVKANVDGRQYDLEVSQPEPDTFLIKNGGRIFEAMVSGSNEASDAVTVSVGGHQIGVKLWDRKRLRGSSSEAGALEGIAEIRSAMPGKVVRILVEVGEEVEKGQGVIVVEAMKMRNELRSPKVGHVKEIRVDLEKTVSSGDVLATIE